MSLDDIADDITGKLEEQFVSKEKFDAAMKKHKEECKFQLLLNAALAGLVVVCTGGIIAKELSGNSININFTIEIQYVVFALVIAILTPIVIKLVLKMEG